MPARGTEKKARPRHGPARILTGRAPAQARYVPCARAPAPIEARGPARHGTISFFYFFIYLYFFQFLGRICAKWAMSDGPTVLNGPLACLPGRAGGLAAGRGPARHGTFTNRAGRAVP